MAEKAELDDRDRKNLYRNNADNIRVVEMSHMELRDYVNGAPMDEELENALDEAQGQVHSQNEDRSYVVIKVVR